MVIKRVAKKIYFQWKNRKKHVRFEKRVNIGKNSKFEGYNRIGSGSEIDVDIGYCSYIGENCVIYGKVGKFCSIASEVRTIQGTHPTDFLSTSPVFYSKSAIQCGVSLTDIDRFNEIKKTQNNYTVEIGNDVWIGARVTILPGITISDGAIIGASTVVTKDIPPYAVVVGNPGRIIRYRFSESKIKELLETKWWEKPLSELSEHVDLFVGDR